MINEVKYIPKNSSLNNSHFDYWDCFQGVLADKENLITPTEVCITFLSSTREELQKLFNVRDKMFSIFRQQKQNTDMPDLTTFNYETGEQLGFLKVFYRDNNEIVLGADRERLDFRISLLLENQEFNRQKTLSFTTTVVYNNCLGRFYFFLIKPFHRLFARRLLKSAIKKLDSL